MPTAIVLPELGAGTAPIRVSAWLVEEGESVEFGECVVEVLVPGITYDVPAPAGGVLERIEKQIGSEILPGDILGWLEP